MTAYPIWPADLGPPLADGIARTPADARLMKAKELGPPESRRRRTLVPIRLPMRYLLDRARREMLERFYVDDLAYGTRYFWMPDWMSDGWPVLDHDLCPILDHDGVPVLISALVLCHMSEPPADGGLRGNHVETSLVVDIMP